MNKFFIPKTALDISDLCKAYGLALVLNKMKLETERTEVIVKDVGFYYEITTPQIDIKRKNSAIGLVPDISRGVEFINRGWSQILKTCKGSVQKRRKLSEYREILRENIDPILNKYSTLSPQSAICKKKDTLYGSIEPAAFKGIRDIKRCLSYTEGSNYKLPLEDIVLISIGAANTGIWIQGREGSVAIFGSPGLTGIPIDSLFPIKNNIFSQIRFHRGGVMPTVVWTSVCLMKELTEYEGEEIYPIFNGLYFHSLKWTGHQPKPDKGGKFSLGFLNKLKEKSEKEIFLDLMEFWINLFRISNRAGLEQLGNTLAEFIINPNLSNLNAYVKIHLHLNLNKKIKLLYEKVLLRELTKYVPVN